MTTLDHFPIDVQRSVDALNALLRVELSALKTYEHAISTFGSAAPKELSICLRSHQVRADKLLGRLKDLGGKPVSGMGMWSVFKDLLQGGLAQFGRKSAFMALEEGEFLALGQYQQASMNIDPDSCWLIEMELLPEQRTTHEIIHILRLTNR